ncbi:DUF6114 domain-containing protein [Dactylosporangium sp. NPDC051485]|uniref:DUF6114 domain-containing protein n=1 Tax=Dactylosporangium sp. NPDC051485 TaxID=3154846 RepID=UPI003414EDD2
MTTSHAAHGKDGADNGGWVAQRPFWGGLFLILSGLELFLSGNLHLALEIHFGPTGFLSYVLPLMMLLCGALSWFSPQQRLFYGILGTVVALYSLIGLNLGGFFLGTVLGLVGGGLAVAWTPGEPAPAASTPQDLPPDEPPHEDTRLDDLLVDEQPGLLRDELPTSRLSPLHGGAGAGSADDQRPPAGGPGELPKRRHLGPLLMAVVVAATIAGAAAHTGQAAYAAPAACPSSAPAKSAVAGTGTTAPATGASTPKAEASPAPSPARTEEDKPGGILGWLGDLFTGGKKEATPTTAAPTTPAPPAPAPSGSTGGRPAPGKSKACASASASPTPNNKKAQLAAGQPFVAKQPSILKADVMTMDSLTYDGVAELPHKDGTTVKVLAFTMKNSVSTPFRLETPGAAKTLLTLSSKLTVEGDVKFYTTSFTANTLGIPLPLTFTPSFPPPSFPLPGFYTACTIELVYVQSNVLTAPALNIAYAP